MLVEGGFISSASEGQRIATSNYRQRLGVAIAQGIQNYNAAVNYRTQGANFAVAKANLPPHTHSISEPLGVESQPGQGSVVTATLPYLFVEDPLRAMQGSTPVVEDVEPPAERGGIISKLFGR